MAIVVVPKTSTFIIITDGPPLASASVDQKPGLPESAATGLVETVRASKHNDAERTRMAAAWVAGWP